MHEIAQSESPELEISKQSDGKISNPAFTTLHVGACLYCVSAGHALKAMNPAY